MAWTGLIANAATVAQLVGVDAGRVISMITQAAATARQNKKDCEHLARRVYMIAELLPHMQDQEAMGPLAGLGDTLWEAHELVMSCQGRGRTRRFFTAGKQAERFRDVTSRIDSFLMLFPVVGYIGIARRLDGTGSVVPVLNRDSVQPPRSHSSQQLSAVPQEEEGAEQFTLAEITVATNSFALALGDGDSATTYKGKLHDGREVAVKRLKNGLRRTEDAFFTELAILSPLSHEHIIRLVGSCAEDDERMLVYEHMVHGTLRDHLNDDHQQPHSSPVAASWKTRVDVLLGAAHAVEHLHCRAVPLIIHNGVTSSNILLDGSWAPRVSGFGASVWRAAGVDSQPVDGVGTFGYADPEYGSTGRVKPAGDVYSLGVVALEVLTGKQPVVAVWEETTKKKIDTTLVSWALPSIQAGKLGDVLDRRPAAEPTPRQREALQLVANMAASCLWLHGDNRPPISDVVANLEKALDLICNEKLGR